MFIDGTSFITLHNIIHPRATTEFIYRYDDPDKAEVFLSFRMETTSRSTEVVAVLAELERKGMKGVDISDNELAKTHARYLIGGRAKVPNERLFRFGSHKPFSLTLGNLPALLTFPPVQNFLRDLVPFGSSCWVYRQVGTYSCSTTVITVQVSLFLPLTRILRSLASQIWGRCSQAFRFPRMKLGNLTNSFAT